MEKILAVIKEEIKAEAVKEDLDLVKLKNLFELVDRVKSMAVNSVVEVTGLTTNSGIGMPIQRVAAYGPSPTERMIGELMPMINTWIETQAANAARSGFNNLLAEYRMLKLTDPDLAEKLKGKILLLAENNKEETNETLHSELPGRHPADQRGSENETAVQRVDGGRESEPGAVSQALQTNIR